MFLKFNFEKSSQIFLILPPLKSVSDLPYIGTFGCQPTKILLSMVSRVLWGLTIRVRVSLSGSLFGSLRGHGQRRPLERPAIDPVALQLD